MIPKYYYFYFINNNKWMFETALCTSTWGRSSAGLCPSQSVSIL